MLKDSSSDDQCTRNGHTSGSAKRGVVMSSKLSVESWGLIGLARDSNSPYYFREAKQVDESQSIELVLIKYKDQSPGSDHILT